MRPRDGVSVNEGEELLEDGEEGPVGQDADALLHLEAAVGDGPSVDDAEEAEPHALSLRQQLAGKRLVELDGCSINLQTEHQQHIFMNSSTVSEKLIKHDAGSLFD